MTPKFLTCNSLNYTNANVTVQVGEAVQEGLRDANKSSRVSWVHWENNLSDWVWCLWERMQTDVNTVRRNATPRGWQKNSLAPRRRWLGNQPPRRTPAGPAMAVVNSEHRIGIVESSGFSKQENGSTSCSHQSQALSDFGKGEDSNLKKKSNWVRGTIFLDEKTCAY